MFTVSVMQLPHVKLTANGTPRQNQPLTVENVSKIIELAGLTLRFNVMRNRFELTGAGYTSSVVDQDRVLLAMEDTLIMLDISGINRLPGVLNGLARAADPYHPMEDWILSKAWDGVDRLDELAKSVPTDSKVWPEYLRKWLIQAVEGVRGWRGARERSIPHVLVFAGGQGAGKGRWLRELAPGFVLADAELHLSSFAGRDHQIQVLQSPIVELGEIDATFKKSEVESLKGFLSRQIDELREPYARTAIRRPRVTVFAGSVNTIQFVNDTTGARRFWPVQLKEGETLDWDHGIDMQQVWAQASALWDAGEDWNLEDYTLADREEEMADFVQMAPIAELAQDHWYKHRKDYKYYAILNRTSIARLIGGSTHPASMAALNDWLIKNLGVARKLQGRKRTWAFPVGEENSWSNRYEFCPVSQAKQYVMEQKAAK